MSDLVPTAKLRYVQRPGKVISRDGLRIVTETIHVLQQWWAPDVPRYMLDESQGEWRDVPLVPYA